jgi:MFS family permease
LSAIAVRAPQTGLARALVLVSVILATGWLAARLGRKRLLVGAVLGFTVSTLLCGLATSLPELIPWRTCQGLFGAPLVQLSRRSPRHLS